MAAKVTKMETKIELTQEAYNELTKELDHRKNVEREEIAKEIAAARELGDLRENHAYTVAMERKDMNENRISELEDMIKIAKIVAVSSSTNLVVIGSKVEILNVATKTKRVVKIVGSEETQAADPTVGNISVDSPIGKALFKGKVGEVVQVETPAGKTEYKIEKLMK